MNYVMYRSDSNISHQIELNKLNRRNQMKPILDNLESMQ